MIFPFPPLEKEVSQIKLVNLAESLEATFVLNRRPYWPHPCPKIPPFRVFEALSQSTQVTWTYLTSTVKLCSHPTLSQPCETDGIPILCEVGVDIA